MPDGTVAVSGIEGAVFEVTEGDGDFGVWSINVEGLFNTFGPDESGRTRVLFSSLSRSPLLSLERATFGCLSEVNNRGNDNI